jgi:DNA mismatch endonuclease (patch repair protein)
MDHVSKEVRSKIMATVRSKGNRTTELALGRILWAAGLRGYRKQWPADGKPDFAWPRLMVAVFVDGCFWHGCTCKYLPRTRTKFWRDKIENNRRRDLRVSRRLRRAGWTVIRVKECAVFRPSTVTRISRAVEASRGALDLSRSRRRFAMVGVHFSASRGVV